MVASKQLLYKGEKVMRNFILPIWGMSIVVLWLLVGSVPRGTGLRFLWSLFAFFDSAGLAIYWVFYVARNVETWYTRFKEMKVRW